MKLVHIRTEHFEADAIFIGEMPSRRVLGALNEPDDIRRAMRVHSLVRSAILDPARRDEYDVLSYDQAMNAVRDYLKGFPVDVPMPADTKELDL